MTSNYRARRRRTAPPRRSLVFARASTKDDESAFYCSVCSGWFVASEPRVDGDDRAAEAPGGGDARAQPAQKAVPTPREIYAGLEEHVVGQHSVKMALSVAVHNQGRKRVRRWPTSKAPISVAFHSFWLTFGRVIISRNGLEA